MKRSSFIKRSAVLGAGLMFTKVPTFAKAELPVVRVAAGQRKFSSKVIEDSIIEFQSKVKDKELGWLFGNCFPNTLDTTVTYNAGAKPDTYVITGDIDAMWLRDSTA